jgi:hypothetical protein
VRLLGAGVHNLEAPGGRGDDDASEAVQLRIDDGTMAEMALDRDDERGNDRE